MALFGKSKIEKQIIASTQKLLNLQLHESPDEEAFDYLTARFYMFQKLIKAIEKDGISTKFLEEGISETTNILDFALGNVIECTMLGFVSQIHSSKNIPQWQVFSVMLEKYCEENPLLKEHFKREIALVANLTTHYIHADYFENCETGEAN